MTLLDMLDSALLKLQQARDDVARGDLRLGHFDASLAHVALHQADAVLISMLLSMPMSEEQKSRKEGALR